MTRRLEWDWYSGTLPDNVVINETAYIESSFSFYLYRSEVQGGVTYGHGASTYLGTMFDVGPAGCVTLGKYALVHGARIICDSRIEIGDYALISWNVLIMDNYRLSFSAENRRRELLKVAERSPRVLSAIQPEPVIIGAKTWIGFGACILPGVHIGEGSVIGAKSVVVDSIPPNKVAAGNPARIVRSISE
jgi:acetyltransferase-like isoleucine patch superfamily enzyme